MLLSNPSRMNFIKDAVQMARTKEADEPVISFELGFEMDENEEQLMQLPVVEVEEVVYQDLQAEEEVPIEGNAKEDEANHSADESRHLHVNDEYLDGLADSSHKINTKNQTKWAVAVFKGNQNKHKVIKMMQYTHVSSE